MVININFKRLLIACAVLSIFLCLTTAAASDVNQTADISSVEEDVDAVSVENENINGDVLSVDNATADVNDNVDVKAKAKTSSGSVFVQNSSFDIQIIDENGKAISKKPVQVTYNSKTSNYTTNANGHIYVKLTNKGTYTLSYLFNADGYTKIKSSVKITVVPSTASKIQGSNYVAYERFKNPYTVVLTTGGVKLPNKKVIFKLNGKYYTTTTDASGKATLNINISKGTYRIAYAFKGVANAKKATGSAKITVKKGMPTKIVRQTSLNFRHQTSKIFKIKYEDVRGNPIKLRTVVFKVNGKAYSKKTDKNGYANITIKLNKGIYTLTVKSYNTKIYKKSSATYSIKVRSKDVVNNGFWLFGSDMKKVNLKTMAKNGVNQIFLNSYAVTLHGKSAVSDFATQAKSLGISVHIWMETFNDGSWVSPVSKSGTYKYSLFNSIIKKAKEYASIDGVSGIHFDYLRFPGTAYKYKNAAASINYFTKQACTELHKLNSKLIVSAAVMSEPSANKYYYGQDIPTLSKYLDVIVPMVYKGNYNQGSSWIKSVTQAFVKQSNGAQIWTGLQGYGSDSNVVKLSVSELTNDADYAGFGGASGVIVFRYSLFNLINFNNL